MKLINSKEIYDAKLFSVMEEQFQDSDKKVINRVTVKHPGAAVFIPRLEDDLFLMVRQYRASVRQVLLEFPAGTLEAGEEPLECAKREIKEEVGYRAEKWTALGELYPTPGFCTEKQFLYLAEELSPETAPCDEDEVIEVERLKAQQIKEAICDGAILDAKSISIFVRYLWLVS